MKGVSTALGEKWKNDDEEEDKEEWSSINVVLRPAKWWRWRRLSGINFRCNSRFMCFFFPCRSISFFPAETPNFRRFDRYLNQYYLYRFELRCDKYRPVRYGIDSTGLTIKSWFVRNF